MRVILLISAALLLASFDTPGEKDFQKIFGNDYTWAENWMSRHENLINKYASLFNLPAKELKSIVFPELIRYNGLFNALEIESLKYLYVQEGKYYADFSVGYFQMKPSFAEMVEREGQKLLGIEWLKKAGWANLGLADNEDSRMGRVKRLASTEQQIIYLCTFYKICEIKFSKIKFASPVEKVSLYATCYNAGYHRSYEQLLSFQRRADFLTHNYASISTFYFARI